MNNAITATANKAPNTNHIHIELELFLIESFINLSFSEAKLSTALSQEAMTLWYSSLSFI